MFSVRRFIREAFSRLRSSKSLYRRSYLAVAISTTSAVFIATANRYASSNSVRYDYPVLSFCEEDDLDNKTIKAILSAKIRSIRERLLSEWKDFVYDMKLPIFRLCFFKNNQSLTHCIELNYNLEHFDYRHSYIWLQSLVNILYPINSMEETAILKNFSSFYEDAERKSLVFQRNNYGSLVITKFKDSNGFNSLSFAFFKEHGLTNSDLDNICAGYEAAFVVNPFIGRSFKSCNFGFQPMEGDSNNIDLKSLYEESVAGYRVNNITSKSRQKEPLSQLEELGVEVFDPATNELLTWDSLAGYEDVKELLQDTILNALKYPEIYDSVAHRTRVRFESNRPKALLLEGPPGTGKTLTARILASQCGKPLVVVNLENIVSKWFGDSEKRLSGIFDACDALEGGAVLFVDEVDALARSRDSDSHEASRRILSVLLNRIEGFHGKSKSVLVCATNRKKDLDEALLSRFDLVLTYELPNAKTRAEIFKRYAKQFGNKTEAYDTLSAAAVGLSCREIKEACEQAERVFVSRLIEEQKAKAKDKPRGRGEEELSSNVLKVLSDLTPSIEDYVKAIQQRSFNSVAKENDNAYV